MNKGQSVIEYLLFFAVVAVITLISLCSFYPRVHQSGQDAFQQVVEEIAQ